MTHSTMAFIHRFEQFEKSPDARAAFVDSMLFLDGLCLVINREGWRLVVRPQLPPGSRLFPTKGSRTVPIVHAGWTPSQEAVLVIPLPDVPKYMLRKSRSKFRPQEPPAKVSFERSLDAMKQALFHLIDDRSSDDDITKDKIS